MVALQELGGGQASVGRLATELLRLGYDVMARAGEETSSRKDAHCCCCCCCCCVTVGAAGAIGAAGAGAKATAVEADNSIVVTPYQKEGGAAVHNPYVMPANAGLATAMNLASQLRRELLYPYSAARARATVDSLAAEEMFVKMFPGGHSAFTAGKDRGKPTGVFIVQFTPGYAREITHYLNTHPLGFIVTIEQGEFATKYNKAVAIERKIAGVDVSTAEVTRAIYKLTGLATTVLHDRNHFDHHIFAFEIDPIMHGSVPNGAG